LIKLMNLSFKCRICCLFLVCKFTVEIYGIVTSLYFEYIKCGTKKCCQADFSDDL
jgi:hypothetical protein